MNAVSRQLQKTVTSPRRFGVVSVAAFLGLVLYVVLTLPIVRNATSVVQYKNVSDKWTTLEPVEDTLCPGETMAYTVTITVAEAPVSVNLLEAWCFPDKQCPREFKLQPDFSLAGEEGEISAILSKRVVPSLPPGEWEFRHMNVSQVDGKLPSVSGYNLFITVPNDCAQ